MKGIVWDALLFLGLATFAAGLAVIHWPSSLLFIGGTLTAIGVVGAKATARASSPAPQRSSEPQDVTQP